MKRVLIVDDSPMIHALLRRTLEKHDFSVCGDAKNGKEAVDMYQNLKPDLVFMDITMPVMDGLQAVREIKGYDAEAKIIMLSAMADESLVEEANSLGVETFLKKPFSDFKILSALAKTL